MLSDIIVISITCTLPKLSIKEHSRSKTQPLVENNGEIIVNLRNSKSREGNSGRRKKKIHLDK